MEEFVDKVYIDANVLVEQGVFISHDFIVYSDEDSSSFKQVLPPNSPNGVFLIKEDFGSPFVCYSIRGELTVYGGNADAIAYARHKSEDWLICSLKELALVKRVLYTKGLKRYILPLLYREQFAISISILENFLYSQIIREIVYNREIALQNVRTFEYGKDKLKLKSCITLSDEEVYRRLVQVASSLVYHRFSDVALLYRIVFRKDVSPFLNDILKEVNRRNNIVHRNGCTLNGTTDKITLNEVGKLILDIKHIMRKITETIKR